MNPFDSNFLAKDERGNIALVHESFSCFLFNFILLLYSINSFRTSGLNLLEYFCSVYFLLNFVLIMNIPFKDMHFSLASTEG